MKTILLSTFVLALTVFTTAGVSAQEGEKHNYVVLTKKVPQLQPILITAEKLKEEDGENFGAFEVIICGQEIGDITDPAKIDAFIEKAEALGVRLIACGFSLNKFKVDRNAVPEKMEIVENGILYNFQLQKKGYHSLGL
ncbi:sulfur reduction protein DsrE [Robertkochia marina]|uniref:Sulfur reduction protein DsrE n=1 Tax=Robertkochia marina TaxID=1227945 RepID=A0A4V3UXZ0_9FLAO|nr:sulfur reduction protein DsrE [Robertkochia marina]THD66604.1 sulfur reduction protein DsrE [Robertkochia marina]TRZ45558.1 sulfur reduction protein DsrE [Robertkochia marina]